MFTKFKNWIIERLTSKSMCLAKKLEECESNVDGLVYSLKYKKLEKTAYAHAVYEVLYTNFDKDVAKKLWYEIEDAYSRKDIGDGKEYDINNVKLGLIETAIRQRRERR